MMRVSRFTIWLVGTALASAGCVGASRTPIEPEPLANVHHDARVSASDRRIATAIEVCFPASQRVWLRYAAAPYEGGDSPVFVVFFDGGHTAVNALNNDLYYDTSRRIVFPVPGEPSVAPDPSERRVSDCLGRARAAAR